MAGNFPNSGELLHGQEFDPSLGIEAQYTEQVHQDKKALANYIGTSGVSVAPMDGHSSKVRTYISTSEQLLALSWKQPVTVDLEFPPVLTGITTVYNPQSNAGISAPLTPALSPSLLSSGTSGGLSFSRSNAIKSTAMIMVDVQPRIVESYARNIPAMKYTFYMASTATQANILAKLTALAGAAVVAWPRFKPVSLTLTLKGQEASFSVDINARHSDSWSSSNISYSVLADKSKSYAGGVMNKTVRLPACIFGSITIANPSQTLAIGGTVATTLDVITGTGIAPSFPAESFTDTTSTVSVTASVSPTTFSATEGGLIPTTGKYLYDLSSNPDAWETNRVTAIVVDFAGLGL